jgi:hypothetical protein
MKAKTNHTMPLSRLTIRPIGRKFTLSISAGGSLMRERLISSNIGRDAVDLRTTISNLFGGIQ